MEPTCEFCLDSGEIFLVLNEATGEGYWVPCPEDDAPYNWEGMDLLEHE